jgi:hypothetical protein
MASIFRQTYKRPIPPGATIATRRGKRVAVWTDKRGEARSAPLDPSGTQIVLEYRHWYIAYKDALGQRRVVRSFRETVDPTCTACS